MSSDILESARAFFDRAKEMSRDAFDEAVKVLPKPVQNAYWEMRKASYFVPENEVDGCRKEVLSPSGKYKLVISSFRTGPGSWNYSQGVVYQKDDDKPIATVQRNYGAFPNLFIEGHPKGNFLVCGMDYQGQTVIDLVTGERRDLMSDGSDKGFGFCWASYTFDVALPAKPCHDRPRRSVKGIGDQRAGEIFRRTLPPMIRPALPVREKDDHASR